MDSRIGWDGMNKQRGTMKDGRDAERLGMRSVGLRGSCRMDCGCERGQGGSDSSKASDFSKG